VQAIQVNELLEVIALKYLCSKVFSELNIRFTVIMSREQ